MDIPAMPSFMGAAARRRKMDLVGDSQPPWQRSRSPPPMPRSARTRSPPPMRRSAAWLDDDVEVPPFHDRRPRPPPMRDARPRRVSPPRHVAPRESPEFQASSLSKASAVRLVSITLPRTAALVSDGYPVRSSALVYDGSIGHMLPHALEMLTALVGGDLESADVAVDHDTDWEVFPEIGKELDKAGAGKAFCVATCAGHSRWAVGVGGKNPQQRQNCAILALVVTMTDLFDANAVCGQWPEFQTLCENVGVAIGRSSASRRRISRSAPHASQAPIPFSAFAQASPPPPPHTSKQWQHTNQSNKKTEHQSLCESLPVLKWISLPELPTQLEGFPGTAPVVEDNKDSRWLIGSATGMLSDLVGSVSEDVKIIDDNDWALFPAVGEALKAAGFGVCSMCIAICEAHSKWAVGIGGQYRRREKAAKLSLCVALAQDQASFLSKYPDFGAFCQNTGLRSPRAFSDDRVSKAPRISAAAPRVPDLSAPKSPEAYQARMVWITLPRTTALVNDGYPAVSGALVYDGSIGHMLPEAQEMLTTLIGDLESADVAVDHDTDWNVFPEIAKELDKAGAGKAFCVATCGLHNRWAVGVGGKKAEHRQNLAMLALCITMLDKCDGTTLFRQWPHLQALCAQAGTITLRGASRANLEATANVFATHAPQPPPQTKKQKKREAQSQNNNHSSQDGMPGLKWISLEDVPEELEGLPEIAPAVGDHADLRCLMGRAHEMLSDMVGSISEDVTIIDDNHWQLFPSVGEALKKAGFAEYSMCVAKSAKHSKWAVGVGGQWKRRENAVKLSLCVAIARDSEESSTLLSRYPELQQFCQSHDDSFANAFEEGVGRHYGNGDVDDTRKSAKAVQKVETERVPREKPFWITIPDDEIIPEELAGFSANALALSTDGNRRKGLYAKADEILNHVLDDSVAQVEYHDDIDWSKLPAVGAGLKAHTESEECFCVAISPDRLVWAVGVSMQSKCRYAAAKIALAATLLLQMGEGEAEGEPVDLPALEAFPAFAQFLEEVRQTESPL